MADSAAVVEHEKKSMLAMDIKDLMTGDAIPATMKDFAKLTVETHPVNTECKLVEAFETLLPSNFEFQMQMMMKPMVTEEKPEGMLVVSGSRESYEGIFGGIIPQLKAMDVADTSQWTPQGAQYVPNSKEQEAVLHNTITHFLKDGNRAIVNQLVFLKKEEGRNRTGWVMQDMYIFDYDQDDPLKIPDYLSEDMKTIAGKFMDKHMPSPDASQGVREAGGPAIVALAIGIQAALATVATMSA